MNRIVRHWRDAWNFRALPRSARQLVFYAEDRGAWGHFGPIIEHLVDTGPLQVCYLTSDDGDPVLQLRQPALRSFAIGSGAMRTMLFSSMQADVVVMTTPDLDQFALKRSLQVGCYVYVHHSMVSTHMVYRPRAFEAFDAVLCVGPHHVRELRADEAFRNCRTKALFQHGYGRLDAMLTGSSARRPPPREAPLTILLAPSWGPGMLLERYGSGLVRRLLAPGHRVIVRPHPMTTRRHPEILDEIVALTTDARLEVDRDPVSYDALLAADVLITDWSGTALEYAFARERPVLFADVPRKVNNPEYERLGEPLEAVLRPALGLVVDPEDTAQLAASIARLASDPEPYVTSIRRARAEWVFNVGSSGAAGARILADIIGTVAAGGPVVSDGISA